MGWWKLAGEWRRLAESIPHGQQEARLTAFAAQRGLKPISVRKAVSVRHFAEELERVKLLKNAERLASVALVNVEALKRVARYGPEHVAELMDDVLSGKLKGRALKHKEAEIRGRGWRAVGDSPNTHAYRLQSSSFKESAIARLPELYPPPAECTDQVDALASSLVVVVDAVVAHGDGYNGVRCVAASSGGDARARLRSTLQLGLASSRFFDEYVFVCQKRPDADELAALFQQVPPCGVGVLWLDGSGTFVHVLEPRRQALADLAVRFYGVFGGLFS